MFLRALGRRAGRTVAGVDDSPCFAGRWSLRTACASCIRPSEGHTVFSGRARSRVGERVYGNRVAYLRGFILTVSDLLDLPVVAVQPHCSGGAQVLKRAAVRLLLEHVGDAAQVIGRIGRVLPGEAAEDDVEAYRPVIHLYERLGLARLPSGFQQEADSRCMTVACPQHGQCLILGRRVVPHVERNPPCGLHVLVGSGRQFRFAESDDRVVDDLGAVRPPVPAGDVLVKPVRSSIRSSRAINSPPGSHPETG